MGTTTTQSVQAIINIFTKSILIDLPINTATLFFKVAVNILKNNWLLIGLILLGIFVFLIIKALLGHWGSLGSFLYNFFYFSIIFIIGLIWGPEVFVSNWFGFFTAVILYPICYLVVGWILEKSGLKRKW